MSESSRLSAHRPGPPVRNNSASLRRALRLLDAVSRFRGRPAGISLTSLAASLEMSKSTVLRLIAPLREEDLIYQDRESGRYRLGPAAARLGAAFIERVDLDVLAADLLLDLGRLCCDPILVLPGQGHGASRTAGPMVLKVFSGTRPDISGNGPSEADRRLLKTAGADRATCAIRERGWWVQIDDPVTGRGTAAAPVMNHLSQVVAAVQAGLAPIPVPTLKLPDRTRTEDHRAHCNQVGQAVHECAAAISERLGDPRRGVPLDDRTPQ